MDIITTSRLMLIPLIPEFLRASAARDQRLAEQILGLKIPPAWFEEQALIKMRLEQLQKNPALQPWLLKAIRLKEQPQMVGCIGFHTSPGPHYLEQIAPGGIEFGYTVFQAYRRQGYAREAGLALMAWAREQHHVSRFILTISPENTLRSTWRNSLALSLLAVYTSTRSTDRNISLSAGKY